MFKGLLGALLPRDTAQDDAEAYRTVLHEAAKIGGTVFGPIPKGVRREFFCLDEHTWVWHEEWTDEKKVHHARTTRYDVRPHGVFKAQDGQSYQPVSKQEALHIYYAVEAYNKAVDEHFLPRIALAAQ